jgi:gas vesicle protein
LGTVIGAIIGAVTTLFLSRVNFKNEQTKYAIKEKHELLLQIVTQISEFEHLAGRLAASLSNTVHNLNNTIDLETARTEFHTQSQSLRKARACLKMLGLTTEHELLESYIELTREVYRTNTAIKKERIKDLAPLITRGPEEFYSSISKHFLHTA